MGGTIIAVAHRLSTLRDVDRVLVLDQGEVVEQGPPAQLARKDGAFARLLAAQRGPGHWQQPPADESGVSVLQQETRSPP